VRLGREWLVDHDKRHITSMFPAPLTLFAPTYMASNCCGAGADRSVSSGGYRGRFGGGHVGNI